MLSTLLTLPIHLTLFCIVDSLKPCKEQVPSKGKLLPLSATAPTSFNADLVKYLLIQN